MRVLKYGVLMIGAAIFAATSVEAAAIQWTSGTGANGHWYWWSFGPESFNPNLANGVPLDPDGPGGADPLSGYMSYLGTITSAEEQTFINNHPDNPQVNNPEGFYWIAASDAAVEGVWRWVAGPETGQLIPTIGLGQNWCAGEPNDFVQSGGEDAAVANWCSGGGWNDLNVSSQNLYLIEWSRVDATAVPEPASLILVSTGVAAMARRRQRRRS